jgi:hypothetical protein
MKTIVKFAIWFAAAFVGLFVWNTVPDFRPIAIWAVPAAIVCYVLSLVAQRTIRRLISDEMTELRHQLDIATNQLTTLDRKITVLLKDALQQRQER